MGDLRSTVSFPVDADGFLSRECPYCVRRFKVSYGRGSPNPLAYCAYCAHHGLDCWWTPEQLEYLNSQALALVDRELRPQLDAAARRFGRSAGSSLGLRLSMEVQGRPLHRDVPPPLEPSTPMVLMRFECCGEAVKVLPGVSTLHCVICGRAS